MMQADACDHHIYLETNKLEEGADFDNPAHILSYVLAEDVATEFTIFETMHYDALYTILAGGGTWDGGDPFKTGQ